jgi:hypothetical protein
MVKIKVFWTATLILEYHGSTASKYQESTAPLLSVTIQEP